MHPPIHHTLENATITYDTVTEHGVQRDLVKDVFFSPAMIQETAGEGSSTCGSSQSDSESEAGTDSSFSPLVTPSDLLQNGDPLFFIGLEFGSSGNSDDCVNGGSSEKSLEYLAGNNSADLPTPPATVSDMEYVQLGDSLKRRLLESAGASKKQKRNLAATTATSKSTPPASPMLPLDLDYFEDIDSSSSSSDDSDFDDDDDNDDHRRQNRTFSFDMAG